MKLVSQLMRPFSIRGVKTGSAWRLKRGVAIALYAGVFAFGFVTAYPFAHLGVMMGLSSIALSLTTVAAIIGSLLFLMWVFDRCIAGRVVLSSRLVRALFTEEQPKQRDRSALRLVQ